MLDRLCNQLGRSRQLVYRIRVQPVLAIDYLSPCIETLTGYTVEDFRRSPQLILRTVHPDDRSVLIDRLADPELMLNARPLRWIHKDGHIIDTEHERITVRNEGGGVVAVEGLIRDVTVLKRTTASLSEVDAKYRALIEQIPAVVYVVDCEGLVLYVSAKVEALTGFKAEEFVADASLWASRLHPEDSDRVRAESAENIRLRRAWESEYRFIHKAGHTVWVRHARAPVSDVDGATVCFQGLLVDLSSAKRMEEQFRQSQKMEAIGRLAGGVAHDFNNLLTVIIGYADLLIEGATPGQPSHADALEIKNAALSAARVTGQLLAISRRQVLAPAPLDLSDVVMNTGDILRRVLSEDIELAFDLGEALPAVEADLGQIERIVMNLVVNSRDAMPTGGTITIRTRAVRVAGQLTVALSVADTGCGIPEDVRRHIFEPFFTTKPKGQGTGLGLATVHGIVVQSGGTITVESEPGRGALFTVRLPAVAGEASIPEIEEQVEMPRCGARVLVVEDDDLVRRLTGRVLEEAGLRVVECDAVGALALISGACDPFDVVVADMVMPTMSGPELVERVTARFPDIAAVFMSGHVDHPILKGRTDAQLPMVQKPFTASAIVGCVHQALSERTRARVA